MNRLLASEFPLNEAQHLRYELLGALTDRDLAYKLPGDNPTLGELCRAMGTVEHSYIQSFKTRTLVWLAHPGEPELATSVARLQAWYTALDAEFETAVQGFSDEELDTLHVDRGHGVTVPLAVQFQIFHEAVLMFYAKADVYLRALQKPRSDEWQTGIG